MSGNSIHYPALIDQAMRGMVRDLLRQIGASGLPGDHHFYISFDTNHPGAVVSEQLKSRYPKEITIVLQHQFWDFAVEDEQFRVTLSFGGVPEKLTVPFAAMTAFADPSVKFGLQFQQHDMSDADMAVADMQALLPIEEGAKANDSAEVISLDAFRKK